MPDEYRYLPESMKFPLRPFIVDRETFGTVLLTCFLDAFGTDGLQWAPETIEMEVNDEFGVDIPAENFDRLMTSISLLTSNSFFVSVTDFTRICVVLSGHHVDQNTLILPDSDDIAWGVTEALLIMPPDDKNENPFQPEITAFIGEVLDSEGILDPPDILQIATRSSNLVNRVNFEYSDDPEMFQMIYKSEGEKTAAINHVVKSRLKAMFNQLKALPLKHGKTEELIKKVLSHLPNDDPAPLP